MVLKKNIQKYKMSFIFGLHFEQIMQYFGIYLQILEIKALTIRNQGTYLQIKLTNHKSKIQNQNTQHS